MAKRKPAKRKKQDKNWLVLVLAVLVFMVGWYWYQNSYIWQEADIYEVTDEPRKVIQEWTFDNSATGWQPTDFKEYQFNNGWFSGTTGSTPALLRNRVIN